MKFYLKEALLFDNKKTKSELCGWSQKKKYKNRKTTTKSKFLQAKK